MKAPYKLANGNLTEIEVNPAIAATLADFLREDENAARKARRRNEASIEAMREETGWEPTDTTVDIEAGYIAREESETLLAALSRLSENQRRLVRLYYYEERTLREISKIMNIHFSCVQRRLETIHGKLKKCLEKKF
jgi:RNA polymerase sigma factor (sigma-70 family)